MSRYGYDLGCCAVVGNDAGASQLDAAVASLVGLPAYAGMGAGEIKSLLLSSTSGDERAALALARMTPAADSPTLYPGLLDAQRVKALQPGTKVGASNAFEIPLGKGTEIVAAFLPRGWMSSFAAKVDRLDDKPQWGTPAYRGGDRPLWVVLTPSTAPIPWEDARKRRVRYIYSWVRDERTQQQRETDETYRTAREKELLADAAKREAAANRSIEQSIDSGSSGDAVYRQWQRDNARKAAELKASAKADESIAMIEQQKRVQAAYNAANPSIPSWAVPAGIAAVALIGGMAILRRR